MGTRILGGRSVLAAAVAAVLLAGCGGDSTAGSEEPVAPTSPATSSPEGSAEPSSTVEPAGGPVLDGGVLRLRVPRGFEVSDQMVDFMWDADDPRSFSSVFLTVVPPTPGLTLADQARISLRNVMPDGSRRLPDVTLDGVDFYRVVGQEPDGLHVEQYGTSYRKDVAILVNVDQRASKAEREELIASVLASFEWVE